MTEHEKARAWRERHALTREQLAHLTGYSYESVCVYERGISPAKTWVTSDHERKRRKKPQGKISTSAWHRYRMACAAVDAMLRNKKHFQWGE